MNRAATTPPFTHCSQPGPAHPPRATRFVILALMVVLVAGCKIVVTVPFGGKVVTEDGFVCLAGEICEIDVSDDSFDSTFTAMPAQGYTFVRWRPKASAFCGDTKVPCALSTTGFAPYPPLLDILNSDSKFFLEPVFVQYKLGYWKKVLAEIEAGTFTTDSFLHASVPNVTNCDPGSLTEAAKGRVLEALNQTRSLNHLPAAEYDDFYDLMQQSTALVQKANNYLNHFPQPSDTCYTARTKIGASTSNLGGGSGSNNVDPASDVFGWTNDNFNVGALMEAGHRRWMLFPELGYVTYGQVAGFSALKVFGYGVPPSNPVSADLEYVAMPFESYPYVFVSKGAKPTPWSFSMVPPAGMSSDFNYFQNATVKVTVIDSGKSLPVQNLHKDNKRFGLANFLSWMVAGWQYDVPYKVKISGISMPGGGTRDIEYPVVIDLYNLFNVNHPLESTDMVQGTSLKGNFNTPADQDSYTLSLAGNKMLSGQSEFSNQAFYILVYDSAKRLVKSSDKAFSHNFAKGKYTIIASLCNENKGCYGETKTYQVSVN